MAQAARLNLRMQKELKLLMTDPPPGVSIPLFFDSENAMPSSLSSIEARIEGPKGTVYSKRVFTIKIQIPERYPFQPPIITFITPIYHPNIDNGGRICLDILNLPPKGAWQPSLNISTVLTSIGLLIIEPNPDDGLMAETSREYKYNRQAFYQKARSWTEKYANVQDTKRSKDGSFSAINPSMSDLHHFELDDRILLTFFSSASQNISWTCSQVKPKPLDIYTGNEKAILLLLLFQFVILRLLALSVRFCCVFWRKKKLQDHGLVRFLEKRRSLHSKRKTFNRMISELEQKTAEESTANGSLVQLGEIVRAKEGLERKLSTCYSLGSDRVGSQRESIWPVYDGRGKSHLFHSSRKERVTIFNTFSDSSSPEDSSSKSSSDRVGSQRKSIWPVYDGKGKSHLFHSLRKERVTIFNTFSDSSTPEDSSSKSSSGSYSSGDHRTEDMELKEKDRDTVEMGPSGFGSGSEMFMYLMYIEGRVDEWESEGMGGRRRMWLKRRTFSTSN